MAKKIGEIDFEFLAMAQAVYFALLNHPYDSWRIHNQAALINARDMICRITGETAQEAQDRCEHAKGDMAIIAKMQRNAER